MTQPYFKKMFLENNITVTVPDTENRAFIDKVIAEELEFGIVNPNSKKMIDSVGVQGTPRLKPRNFGNFRRYPQSAYVQYALIVCLVNCRNSCG